MVVIDLGASPGGWSTYTLNKIGTTGKIFACDKLPMKKIVGVNFIQGDCSDPNFLNILFSWIRCKKVQVILSDMSPNITGISVIDVNRSIYLGNIALAACRYFLSPGGDFLVKIFQGIGFEEYLYSVRSAFSIVKIRKPNASRIHSKEVYIVAKKLKNVCN